jgi:hypothetical protein
MWVKKTKEEIKKEPRMKKHFFNAFFMAILLFFFQIFADKTGITAFKDFKQLEWDEVFQKIPNYLLISAGVFLVLYLFQAWGVIKMDAKETTYICDKCNKKKTDDGKYDCECGGKYIRINKMKWVEDKESNENKKME